MSRIITGSAKGMKLAGVHGFEHINDRAKGSLFSVIGSDIVGKRVLDLFAGYGSIGIEALSRGALHCTFIENSRPAAIDIKQNLERAKFSDRAYVTRQKVLPFLNEQAENSFDIVFANPPQHFFKGNIKRITGFLENVFRVIPPGGAIALKHQRKTELPEIDGLKRADSRTYGGMTISLFVRMK